MTKVFIAPRPGKADATGGIARVVEAQAKWLPEYDIDLVPAPREADVLALHASWWEEPSKAQRVVAHCHGLYWAQDNWPAKWYSEVNKQVIDTMRKADVITCPSEWVAQALRVGGLWSPQVIGHGVDTELWVPTSGGHTGYILWDKARQDAACDPRAVNVLASAMPDMKFISTFGDPARNVHIIGERPHTEHREVVQHAALYLATARETFGISILEALACGVPVVGWDWGGQAEILRSNAGDQVGLAGILVPVGDYDALTKAVRYCFENRTELSQNARRLAESKYQWKDVVAKYALLYKGVATGRPNKRVSVIIPSYNLSKYLVACIESVLRQDYPLGQLEIIVVDDCSTDGSYDIAKTFADKLPDTVKLLKTPSNMNMPGVLNLGLSVAQGEYVMNLDADNMLAPGILRTLVDALDQDRDLDIAYGKLKFVLDDGVTPDVDTSKSADGISNWPPYVASYEASMAHKNQIPSTALIRMKLAKQVGGYRHRCFRLGEDPDFWIRCLSVGAVAKRVTDQVMLLYRMRTTSRSATNQEWAWESWYTRKPIQVGGSILAPVPTPQVSVIIPCGPGHQTQGLEDALDSVYSQTLTSWECIVVNDTGAPFRSIPPWVRLLDTSGPRMGTSVARNIGLRAAQGETVVFLDADDFLENDALSKMYQVYKAYPQSYVYTDWYKTGDGHDTSVSVERHDAVGQLQALRHPITCMFDTRVRDMVMFDESMQVGEDWDFVLGVLANGWCGVHLPEPLVYYRLASGGNRRGLLADIERIREQVSTRWREKIMACGCQSQVAQVISSGPMGQGLLSGDSELVLLEFVQPETATMSWTGKATGHVYRFGSDNGHRVGYVHKADAAEFVKRPEFRLANAGNLAAV